MYILQSYVQKWLFHTYLVFKKWWCRTFDSLVKPKQFMRFCYHVCLFLIRDGYEWIIATAFSHKVFVRDRGIPECYRLCKFVSLRSLYHKITCLSMYGSIAPNDRFLCHLILCDTKRHFFLQRIYQSSGMTPVYVSSHGKWESFWNRPHVCAHSAFRYNFSTKTIDHSLILETLQQKVSKYVINNTNLLVYTPL